MIINRPPEKRLRHPLKKYKNGPQRTRGVETTEQLSMLNADKTKTNFDRAIIKYYKFVKSHLPRIPVYKNLTGSHLKSTENYLGLSNMLSNFDMFIQEDKQ